MLIVARWIFLPAIVLIILMVCGTAAVAMLGDRADARVTDIRIEKFSSGNTKRIIEFDIVLDGLVEHHSKNVSTWTTNWRKGDTINIRHVRLLGMRFTTIADGWNGFLDEYYLVLVFAIALLLFGLPLSIHLGWAVPRRERRLIRDGTLTTATICDIPPSPQPTCTYEFFGPASEKMIGTASLPPLMAAKLKEGDPLTVIYDANDPTRHVVYEFCDFVAVSEEVGRA